MAYDLKGHAQSILAVVAINGEEFLTGQDPSKFLRPHLTDCGTEGSADKTIKLWRGHKAVRSFTEHKDAVRGLALVTDIGFASCSNDRRVYRDPFLRLIHQSLQRDTRLDVGRRSSLFPIRTHLFHLRAFHLTKWRYRFLRRRSVRARVARCVVSSLECLPWP